MSAPGSAGEEPSRVAADPGQPMNRKKPSRRRTVVMAIVGLVVMAGIFALLLPQVASYEEAFEEVRGMPVAWVVALVVAGLLNIALYPLTVLVAVPGLRYGHGFIERQSGFLISNVVPGGGAIAVGTQYAILARYGVSGTVSAAAVSADAVWTYLLTLGMPAVAVVLLVLEGRSTAGLTSLAVIGMLVVVVSVVVIVVVLRSEAGARRLGRWAHRLIAPAFRRLHRPAPDVAAALVGFREHAQALVSAKWLPLTVTNVIAQFTPFLVLFCAVAGLGSFPDPLSLVEIFAAYSAALLLVSIPITPGGLGTVDAALIALLTTFGAEGSVAVAADLVWRLVWFLPQLLVGAATMVVYAVGRRRSHAPAGA